MTDFEEMYFNNISQPSFEGAVTSYRKEQQGLVYGTHDNLAAKELLNLQLRSAHAIRNNGYAKAAQKKYVENLKSIRVNWLDKNGKLHKNLQDYWDEFAENPNLDGYGDLSITQSNWHSSMFQSGNSFTRLHIRRNGNKNKIPLKIETIQSEFHDIAFGGYDAMKDIRTGIEFVDTKPAAYYFLRARIDTTILRDSQNPYKHIRIPADEIVHMFIRDYPGQWIGIPFLSSVLIPLYEIDELADATTAKQKAAQAISWIVKNTNPMNIMPVGAPAIAKDKDQKDKIVFRATGGNVQYLNKGEDIAFYQSTDVGPNLLPFIKSELQRIASALGLPYYQLTGDYSGIDFSTLRGISIELRNRIEFIHHFYTIPLGLTPITRKFKELASLYVKKTDNAYPTFQMPRWYGVDELKDAMSDVLEVQNGMATLQSKLDERHMTFEEIIADRERIREIGLDNLLYPNGQSMAQANNNQANPNSDGNA